MSKQDISKAKIRASLPPRREPYYQSIKMGCAVGYRVNESGRHTWTARYRLEGEKQFTRLGYADTMTHSQAVEAANKWFSQCDAGQRVTYDTVESVCKAYVNNRRMEKGERTAKDAEKRFTAYVYGTKLGHTKMRKLRKTQVEGLRDQIALDSSKGNANRYLRSLKAALNYGLCSDMATNDVAWRTVKAFPNTDKARELYLTPTERQKVIGKCYPWLGALLTGLALTAARPGELRQTTVADLDLRARTLRLVTRKGNGGEERVRYFPLSNPQAFAFFKQQAMGKLPAAPLFPTAAGGMVDESVLSSSVRKVRRKQGLHPEFCAYVMRHCAISDWLAAGVPVGDVAKLAGTSIEKISAHYHKFIQTQVEDKLAAVNLI